MDVADEIGFAGFGSLAVLWTAFAGAGLRAVRNGDVAAHRRRMLRAFAMTYAAVTLRLWLVLLVPVTGDFRTALRLRPVPVPGAEPDRGRGDSAPVRPPPRPPRGEMTRPQPGRSPLAAGHGG